MNLNNGNSNANLFSFWLLQSIFDELKKAASFNVSYKRKVKKAK